MTHLCQVIVDKLIVRTFSTFASTTLEAPDSSLGGWAGLNVPVGFEALPRNVSTSPLVNIPRTPVPLIFSGSETLCSRSKRATDGKSGRECDTWCVAFGVEAGVGANWVVDACSCLEAVTEPEGSGPSSGTSILEISSPSSARRAMAFPTGMFFCPS